MANRYRFELARSPKAICDYYALRQTIFCYEQGLFEGSDADAIDQTAYPIVALQTDSPFLAMPSVVGVVRIYETEPRQWYGGRLGVHIDYRRVGRIGKGLIIKAVSTANAWGCDRFLATVQLQNVRFFRRLHWQSLESVSIQGRPHHLMEADLAAYPPGVEPRFMPPSCEELQAS
ncbi:MAG: MSMEG_0567/Sll0786 family nitrogen starvation N-acetyltransferase [Elainellaceae cyanobacterium]